MATREQVIAEARTWIKTPWRHQGRLKGISCDCVGVVVGVGVALGLLPPGFNPTGYSRSPDPAIMRAHLKQYLDRIAVDDLRGGEILLLAPRRIAQHLGIYTFDNSIIHAIDETRGVREHRLDDLWRSSIISAYSYRGLED